MHGKYRLMRPVAELPASCYKWWRLAVLLRALVGFSHVPSLDRLNLHKIWQALRDSHPPGRIWSPTRPLGLLEPVNVRGLSSPKLVELDGYAPSRPHCRCGVLLLSLQPQKWTRWRELDPRHTALQAGPFAAWVHRVILRLRSLGVGRLLRRPPSLTAGNWWSWRELHPHRTD